MTKLVGPETLSETIKRLMNTGETVIFEDDFDIGNVLYVEGDTAFYMHWTDEVEKDINISDFKESNFKVM